MKYYLIMRPDEDGNPATIVNEKEFSEFLSETETPPMTLEEYLKGSDPNYWQDDSWFAAEVKSITIKPTKLAIVEDGRK